MARDKKSNLIRFGFLCALVFWQLNIISAYVVDPFLQGNGLSWKRAENEFFGSDFLHYYVSGVIARSVDRLHIFEVPVHFPYMNSLIAPREITKDSCLPFSPPMIAIMSAVSLLPPVPAYILWTLSSLGFGAVGLVLLLKKVGHLSNYQIAVFIIATSASLSGITAMRMGQWTWWLIGFFCFFFLCSRYKKQIISGVCLGLLAVKPQYCLPIFILTSIEKRWLTLAVAGVTFAILSAWAVGLIGLDNVLHYPRIVYALSARPDMQADMLSHCSLRGLFSSFLPTNAAVTATSVFYFAALSVVAVAGFLHRAALQRDIYWIWAIGVLVALIFAPLMFQYDAALVCVPAALTLTTVNPAKINKLQPISLRVWHWIFFFYPFFTWVRGLLGNELNYLYAFVNLGLLACSLLYLRYRKKEVDS